MSVLIRNGTLVSAEGRRRADVLVEGERIARIEDAIDVPAGTVIDAAGRYVIPGGVDVHTHMELPVGEVTSSDDFFTGTRAAAFGGTTTIVDFAVQDHGEPLRAGYDRWRAKADPKVAVDYGLHLIVRDLPPEREPEMDALVGEGVSSFKLFMAYPGVNMTDDGTIFRAMLRAKGIGGLVMLHAENGPVIEELRRRAVAEGRTEPLWHAATRPPETEGEAVGRAVDLAAVAGSPVYIVHLSSAHALARVREGRARGVPVLAETCPQYLFLSDDLYDAPGFEGAAVVMSPPLRPAWHRDVLWEGLATGDLQAVATDHCPFCMTTGFEGLPKQKELGIGDFTRIPNGAPGVETRMLLLHDAVREGRLTLEQWVDVCCTAPARIMGLYPRKGVLKVGADADIVIWDPEKAITLSAPTLHMRVDYSPYEGRRITGAPEKVLLRGRVIVDGERFLGGAGEGLYLPRAPFRREG